MWPFTNKIPFIETISENQENEIEIKHSYGNFKINKKDIIEIQQGSDYYSLNSSPNYSKSHSIKLMLIYFAGHLRDFPKNLGVKSLTLNDIRFIMSICISGGISNTVLFLVDIEFKFIVFILFTFLINLLIDKPLKNIVFPFFFKIFFRNFIKNDLITIKTAGNNFIFRGILNETNLELFSLSKNFENWDKHHEKKRRIGYFFFFLNCFIFMILPLILLAPNENSIFKVTFKDTPLELFYIGFTVFLILIFLPYWVSFGLGIFLMYLLFAILAFTHGIAILSALLVGFFITEFLLKKITNGYGHKVSGWLLYLFGIILIGSNFVYYFSMEEIIYLPINTWVKSLNPIFYSFYLDSNMYLFIISIFSYFTAYSTIILSPLSRKKVDKPIS